MDTEQENMHLLRVLEVPMISELPFLSLGCVSFLSLVYRRMEVLITVPPSSFPLGCSYGLGLSGLPHYLMSGSSRSVVADHPGYQSPHEPFLASVWQSPSLVPSQNYLIKT